MTDPWSVHSLIKDSQHINSLNIDAQHKLFEVEKDSQHLGFEDSFIPDNNSNQIAAVSDKNCSKEFAEAEHHPLPDSEKYLKGLERKLQKIKKSPKLLDALSEKRDDCLRSMLQVNSSSGNSNDLLLELDTAVTNTDSAVQNLYRQIQPVQPITVGETVQIVKYDQLEEQRLEAEVNEEQEENLPASR